MNSTVDVALVRQSDRAIELAEGPTPSLALSLLPVREMQITLAEYDVRRQAFRRWLLSQLVEGVHYGIPPGCEPTMRNGVQTTPIQQWRHKPSLYKAGADFLCDLIMVDPSFEPDMDSWKMLGGISGTVVIRCRLLSRGDSPFFPGRPKGEIIGEGRGAGVNGVKKRDANGAVKIAQKCAKVDAVINALGISDLFTQDLEDKASPPMPAPDADESAPKVAPRAERQTPPDDGIPRVTGDDLNTLFYAWRKKMCMPKGKLEQFAEWARKTVGCNAPLASVSDWTIDARDVCREALK